MIRSTLMKLLDLRLQRSIVCVMVAFAVIVGFGLRIVPAQPTPESELLEIRLVPDSGEPILATVQRSVEIDRIPVVANYEIISTSVSLSDFEWSVHQQAPNEFFTTASTQVRASSDARSVTILLSSNRPEYEIRIEAVGASGTVYRGEDYLHRSLSVGERIRLGASDASPVVWQQAFAAKESLEYVTQNRVQIQSDQDGSYFVPDWPGNYRFVNTTNGEMASVEAYVGMETSRVLSMRGAFVADYYGTHWIPPNNVNIDREIILATTGLAKDLGANTFCVVNFWKVMQWYPIPLFCSTEGGPSISMTMLNGIGDACEEQGLDLYLHLGNYTPWPYHNADEDAKFYDPASNDAEWYRRYFEEVERFALYNVRGAAEAGIDLFTAQARSGNMYAGDNFERYSLNQHCEQLIRNIQEEYSGAFGWCTPNPDKDNNFLFECDFVHLFLNRDLFRPGCFRDDSQPTPEEIRDISLEYLSRYDGRLPPKTDVFVNVSTLSADNQVSIPGETEDAPIDYQEQVAFLEGFFAAIHDTPWITGAAVWNLFWIDWDPELAEAIDDGAYNSIRGKPAEEVVRLWFDVLGN